MLIFSFILIIIIFITLIFIFFKSKKSKLPPTIDNLKKYLNNHNISYQLANINSYTYKLEIGPNIFVIFILNIPNNSELSINNRTTWELRYGAGSTPGKVQPFKKYIHNINKFMNDSYDPDIFKIVITSNFPKRIAKYINESEMVIVTPQIDVYNTRVLTENDFEFFINENLRFLKKKKSF